MYQQNLFTCYHHTHRQDLKRQKRPPFPVLYHRRVSVIISIYIKIKLLASLSFPIYRGPTHPDTHKFYYTGTMRAVLACSFQIHIEQIGLPIFGSKSPLNSHKSPGSPRA